MARVFDNLSKAPDRRPRMHHATNIPGTPKRGYQKTLYLAPVAFKATRVGFLLTRVGSEVTRVGRARELAQDQIGIRVF